MSIQQRSRPCPIRQCALPILQNNDQWHIRYDDEGGFTLTMGHDLTQETWDTFPEEIEEYD